MNPQRQNPPSSWPLKILFLLISLCVITIGILYYFTQKNIRLEEQEQELSAISDLKIRQFTQWRLERMGNARFLSENILLIKRVSKFFKGQQNRSIYSNLLQGLSSLTENYDYKNALLIDTACKVRLAYPENDTLIGSDLKSVLPGLFKERKLYMSDIHSNRELNYVHIDLVVPLVDMGESDTLVIGVLVLRIDPSKVLFPLIESWPTPSRSAETHLIRRDGDEAIYLNEAGTANSDDLFLHRPITSKDMPVALAFNGVSGSTDAVDNKGVHVIASMKKIPGTPWYLIAKIDRSEVLSSLNNREILVVIIIFLLISTTGLFLGILLRNQKVRYYREKYENELDRLALVRHFEYILKFANDIILLIDQDRRIFEANDHALEVYNYTREEFIGMELEKIRAPETLTNLEAQLKYVRDNGHGIFETFHKKKDGSVFPVEISSRIVNIEGVNYYQTIARDITERKSAEDTLKESEERFRKIFDESPFSMVMTGKDLGIIRANQSFCRMTGYDEEELKSLSFFDFTHPDFISNDEISLLKLVAKEIPIYHTEKKYIRKNGSVIWGSTTVSIYMNNKEEVQFFLGMVEDITSRKETEAALEKSFSLLKATLESTADGILVVDSEGNIVQFNQKFSDMWRIPQELLDTGEDRKLLEFVKDQLTDPEIFVSNVDYLYADPEITTYDLLEFNDGRFFERYSQPQKINGKSVGRVWSFRDITDKKKAERDIISAKEKAIESDRLKTAFLHNVSHEIRTPMNAIIGFSSLLSDKGVSDNDRSQYVDIISQSGTQLLSIINDIVDIANIEAGQSKVNMSLMNINSVLKSLNEQFKIKERAPGVTLNLIISKEERTTEIMTDPTKLIQILSNLLNNAIKFTLHGSIDFGYSQKEGFIEFFVNDTGIGISEEHQMKIFDRFYQVDGAISRRFGGTGLGLSICKAYTELLGGNICLSSEPGTGSRFSFTIPYLAD